MPAGSSKFTLSIYSPNNTGITGPSGTDINGLGLITEHSDDLSYTALTSVTSARQEPTEFWFNSKGLLTDRMRNGTLRYAYVDSFDLSWKPVSAGLTFDVLNDTAIYPPGSELHPVWLKWAITSDGFLIPEGSNVKDLPWTFCPSDPPRFTDPNKWDGSYGGMLGLGAPESGCTQLKGVKVHRSE